MNQYTFAAAELKVAKINLMTARSRFAYSSTFSGLFDIAYQQLDQLEKLALTLAKSEGGENGQ